VALFTGFVDVVTDFKKLVFVLRIGCIQGFHHGVMQVVRMTDPGSQFPAHIVPVIGQEPARLSETRLVLSFRVRYTSASDRSLVMSFAKS